MQKSKEAFWAVSKKYEEYLRTAAQEFYNSKRKENQEDWQFLETMKMPDRPGSVGPVDVALKKYGKRIKNRKQGYKTKCDFATCSQTVDKIS